MLGSLIYWDRLEWTVIRVVIQITKATRVARIDRIGSYRATSCRIDRVEGFKLLG